MANTRTKAGRVNRRPRPCQTPSVWPPAWAMFESVEELQAPARGEPVEKPIPPIEQIVGERIAARTPGRAPDARQDATEPGHLTESTSGADGP